MIRFINYRLKSALLRQNDFPKITRKEELENAQNFLQGLQSSKRVMVEALFVDLEPRNQNEDAGKPFSLAAFDPFPLL